MQEEVENRTVNLAISTTRTMPPLSADGRLTIPLKLPRKRAYPITATRREKVYETSF